MRRSLAVFVGLLLGVSVTVGVFADANETAVGDPNALAQASLSVGGYHTCALLSGGTVKCWGENGSGQLGDGSTTDSSTPVEVSSLSGVTAISSGGDHTCALLSGGTVKCWGFNAAGQLGNAGGNSSTPVVVSSLSGVTAISSGGLHTCALLSDGTVKCWGKNAEGQLGNGSTDNSSTPVEVSSLSNVTAISSGGDHTCALLSDGDGTVKCWGSNDQGRLGNNSTTDSSTPVAVSSLSGVTAISSGGDHTCALLSDGDGTVKCWGYNLQGQLGNNSTTDSWTPVAVSSLSGVTAISSGGSSGGEHTCGLLSGGTVKCWGYNAQGQLGDGESPDPSSTPVAVKSLSGVTAISSGGYHTCGLLSDGTVKCWGNNPSGQLGNGSTANSPTPVAVSSLAGVGVKGTTPRVPGQVPPWPEAVVTADGSVRVSWDVPFQDGAGPITGYRVLSFPTGGSCVTSPFDADLLSCVVAGLELDVDYLFEVFASNGVGEGPGRMTQQAVRLLPEVPATTVPETSVPETTAPETSVGSVPESVAAVGPQPLPVTGSDDELVMWSLLLVAFGAFVVLRVRSAR